MRSGPTGALPEGMPTDLPIVERQVVRVVVRDREGRVLLFHTREAPEPELGQWWEMPGGGIDPGESVEDAARREVFEEAGIDLTGVRIGAPTWRRTGVFRHRGVRRLSREVVVEARLEVSEPAIVEEGRADYEVEDYFGHRWWPLSELVDSDDRFYPRSLPVLIGDFLAGAEIDEPIEFWS